MRANSSARVSFKRKASAFLLLFLPLIALAQDPPTLRVSSVAPLLTITWDTYPDPAAEFELYAGKADLQFTTNWMVTDISKTTNTMSATLDLARLQYGTNWIRMVAKVPWAVAGQTNNVSMSDFSNAIIIRRLRPPVVRLSITVQASTNLTAWSGSSGEAYALLSADKDFQYFRPLSQSIEVVQNTSEDNKNITEELPSPSLIPPTP